MVGSNAKQEKSTSRRAGVIVVGAGLAGLAAAYELRQADVDVVVIEARGRVGGRVKTVPLASGGHFDAGGEFISPGHTRFLQYAERFDVAIESSKFYEQQPRVTLGDHVLSPQEVALATSTIDGVFARLAAYAEQVDPAAPWKAPRADAWDHLSLRDWLDTQGLALHSRELLRLYWEGGNGISLESQSFLAILAQISADPHPVNALRCAQGASALAHAFANRIGWDRIFLRSPVVTIEYEGQVRITVQNDATFHSDWVILAIPPGTWEDICFRPALFDGSRSQMGTAVKFAQAFSADANSHGYALCNAYVTATWTSAADVLVGFAGGPAARQCLRLHPPTRQTDLQNKVHEMLGHPLPQVTNLQFTDWTTEPFTKGGYSVPAPGQMTHMQGRLEKAHHRLLFAGEHTSSGFFGFMEGALLSGEKAAQLVNDAAGPV